MLRAYPLARACLESQAHPVCYPNGGANALVVRFDLLAVESDLRTSTRFDLRQTCQCSPSPGAHKAEVPYTTSPNRFRAGEPVGGLRNIRLFPSLFVAITCQKPFAKGIAPGGISLTAAANVRVHTLYEGYPFCAYITRHLSLPFQPTSASIRFCHIPIVRGRQSNASNPGLYDNKTSPSIPVGRVQSSLPCASSFTADGPTPQPDLYSNKTFSSPFQLALAGSRFHASHRSQQTAQRAQSGRRGNNVFPPPIDQRWLILASTHRIVCGKLPDAFNLPATARRPVVGVCLEISQNALWVGFPPFGRRAFSPGMNGKFSRGCDFFFHAHSGAISWRLTPVYFSRAFLQRLR